MNRFIILIVLFNISCTTSSFYAKNVQRPSLFKKSEVLQIIDGHVWIEPSTLAEDSESAIKIKQLYGKFGTWDFTQYIEDFLGTTRVFTFVNEKVALNAVAVSAEYYKLNRSDLEKKFGDCNGYPEESIRISFKINDNHQNGFVIAEGSKLLLKASKDFPDQYREYRRLHLNFVETTYPKMFPSYGPTIDEFTYGATTPDQTIFFFGPSPAIYEDKQPIYKIKKNNNDIESIFLPSPVTCST